VKNQLDASEIGTCGLFTISRPSTVGEISICVNDDYTDCVIERDDTGLFSDSFSDEHNGKKRGAIITIPNNWDKNKVPIMYGNCNNEGITWHNIGGRTLSGMTMYDYNSVTGEISFIADNINPTPFSSYITKFNLIIFEGM